jgi:hypothetical protein
VQRLLAAAVNARRGRRQIGDTQGQLNAADDQAEHGRIPAGESAQRCQSVDQQRRSREKEADAQNELDGDAAARLVRNGLLAVGEDANMPSTRASVAVFQDAGVLFAPGKAANAGGVRRRAASRWGILRMLRGRCG